MGFGHLAVVRLTGWRQGQQPAALRGAGFFIQHYKIGRLFRQEEGKERAVAQPFQALALETLVDAHRLGAEDRLYPRLGQDQLLLAALRQVVLDDDKSFIRAGSHRGIGRQHPGEGAVDQQRGGGVFHQRHAHIRGGLLHLPDAQSDLPL